MQFNLSIQFYSFLNSNCILLLILFLHTSCKQNASAIQEESTDPEVTMTAHPKYSLAQWSFHKELFSGEMDNFDFVRKADELGFEGVEFVNQFFKDKVEDFAFLDSLKQVLKETSVTPVMIMVDLSIDLGDEDVEKRKESLNAHKKWIMASNYLGCESMRVNAHGYGSAKEALKACVEPVRELAEFAKSKGITLLIENHGGHSSDADWMLKLIESIASDNLRILADFDNWCLERENGKLWGAPCVKWYDRYEGMDKLLPLASGLSLKSFEFDEAGNETRTDFKKMFALVKKHNYKGWLGVEFEGENIKPEQGIVMTKALADKVQKSLLSAK